MIKVLITSRSFGEVSAEPLELLRSMGAEIVTLRSYEERPFEKALRDADALIIGGHPLTSAALSGAKKLKLVCKHGAGLDNLNLPELRARGIKVSNVPATNADAVADMAFALMLCTARRVLVATRHAKEGNYSPVVGVDVCHKTLGLAGFGAIARRVAKRARGFDMDVMTYDPFLKEMPAEFSFVRQCGWDELLSDSDFVSIHVPLSDETRNLMDANAISRMKAGSFVINTSRGGIVNEQALFEALLSGHIAGAGLDVLAGEPSTNNPLFELDKVVISPHIAMCSVEALGAVSTACAQNIKAFFAGQSLKNEVK